MTTHQMQDRLAVVGGTVVIPDGIIENGIVLLEDGTIRFVGSSGDAQPEPNSTIIQASDKLVLPGFIDTHVHGSHGYDVMTDGTEGIRKISQAQLRYGTTSYLPTTVSAHHDELLRALDACIEAEANPEPAAEIIGIHLEGPFINYKKKGAQSEKAIRDPDLGQCEAYLRAAAGRLKIMTLAPELPGGIDLVRLLHSKDVIASLGHSDADYETAMAAIDAGASHATHLYNAMPALHHREPNLTVACLNEPRVRAEIIADGLHVSPAMVKLAAKLKGRNGLILITDAMAAVGCPDGIYRLGAEKVRVENARATLLDGVTIASSLLTMNQALLNATNFTGLSLADVAYMGSTLPAQLCCLSHRKGSLEPGKDADLAILNTDYSTFLTVSHGQIAYRADKKPVA